jgi:beta-lactam-binding protein with PASTA domain
VREAVVTVQLVAVGHDNREEEAMKHLVEFPSESGEPILVEVEDVGLGEAENILDAAGLRLGRTAKSWSDDVPEDMIVEQNRAPRGKVERGSFVNITVSARRGRVRPRVLTAGLVVVVLLSTGGIFLYRNLVTPQPQTTPQLQTLVVPNLLGMDEEEAAQRVGDDFSMSVSSTS